MRSKNLTKNIIASIILQVCTMLCGLILPRLIIATYGSSTNGLISSITQFLSFISILDGGIGIIIKATLYKPIAKNDQKHIERILKSSQKFLNHILLVFSIYVIILCIVYPLIVNGDDSSYIGTSTLIIAIALSSVAEYSLCFIYRIYLDASQRGYIVSIIQTASVIVSTILAAALIHYGANISIVKFSTAIVYFLRAIVQSLYVKRRFNIKLAKKYDDTCQLNGRWDGFLQHIATVIHDNADVIILTICTTTAWISVYSVYSLVTTSLKGFVKSFSNGLDSMFGEMLAKKEDLNQKLQIYEFIYYTIITIIFSCALVLITPFVTVYTYGITDASYYQPIFGYIIIAAQMFWAIRQPYDAVVFAAGEFKSTRNGAIAEALVNVIISVALVNNLGLIGVAIGTLAAMILRTILYIVFASRKTLKRSNRIAASHIFVAFFEIVVAYVIFNLMANNIIFNSYGVLIKVALQFFVLSTPIIIGINCFIFHQDFLTTIKIFRQNISRKKR